MPVSVTDSATIGRTNHWQETIRERRKYIEDTAKCRCGTDQATCQATAAKIKGPEGLCCWGGIPGHGHVQDERALIELLEEIAAGVVRTLAEVNPPRRLGPEPVNSNWTLWQSEWWYPKGRPALRIADMEDCHRYNTAEYLKRRAGTIVHEQHMRMIFAPAIFQPGGDMACDAFDREIDEMLERPISWVCGTPLLRALTAGLPTVTNPTGSAARSLIMRAVHWHTCPMRLLSRRRPRGSKCTCPPKKWESPKRDLDGAGEEWRIRDGSAETYPEPG